MPTTAPIALEADDNDGDDDDDYDNNVLWDILEGQEEEEEQDGEDEVNTLPPLMGRLTRGDCSIDRRRRLLFNALWGWHNE